MGIYIYTYIYMYICVSIWVYIYIYIYYILVKNNSSCDERSSCDEDVATRTLRRSVATSLRRTLRRDVATEGMSAAETLRRDLATRSCDTLRRTLRDGALDPGSSWGMSAAKTLRCACDESQICSGTLKTHCGGLFYIVFCVIIYIYIHLLQEHSRSLPFLVRCNERILDSVRLEIPRLYLI